MQLERLKKLGNGERVSAGAAMLLLAVMFLDWFGVKAVNTSQLLFEVRAGGPAKNVWEALDYIPTLLVAVVVVVLAVAALRLVGVVRRRLDGRMR